MNANPVSKSLILPDWVPEGASHYLAHTELGQPIRALARRAGCHASTILRQIRRIETRRDDPLVDAALRGLGSEQTAVRTENVCEKETPTMSATPAVHVPDEATLTRDALRVLPRLCETGAVLAVAAEMDKAVVVRDTASGGSTRTAVVAATVAQAMALKDWIAPANTGRIIRYHITSAGRTALARMIEAGGTDTGARRGFAEQQAGFDMPDSGWNDDTLAEAEAGRRQRMRYSLAESPLIALSRRKDKDGKPFIADALVHAGEHLREDFELAQMGNRVTQNWDSFLTAGTGAGPRAGHGPSDAPRDAQARVAAALTYLGPGLSDVALRCCCYLEGLETTEKRLGWSARSGKIVLRIALMRLKRHYDDTIGPGGPMIG